MRKIKTIIGAGTAGIVAFLVPLFITTFTVTAPVAITGCVSPPSTNSQQVIDATSMILENTARAGALAAITPPTGNTNNAVYFKLASTAIGTFLTGQNFTPGALQDALMKLNVPQLNDVWVQLAVGGIIDLYTVYYGQYVEGQVNGNLYAGAFLQAIQRGFNEALNGRPAQLKVSQPFRGTILPRPIRP